MNEEMTKMFCTKCGAEMDSDSTFCPKCGAPVNGDTPQQTEQQSRQPSMQPFAQQPAETGQPGKKEKKKGSKKKIIIVFVVVAVIIGILSMAGMEDSSIDADALIAEIQNGYLGNYDAITLREALDYEYGADGEWSGGVPADDEDCDSYFVVTYEVEDSVTIQFQIYEEDDTEFHVTYLAVGRSQYVYETASDMKMYLDMLYDDYLYAYPDCGIVVDESEENDTLLGHFASTKTTEETSTAESDGNSSDEEDETSSVREEAEDSGLSSQEYQLGFRDGVSENYETTSFMVDTATILDFFHDQGYEYVWLESHEIKIPENGQAGDFGTQDIIQLELTKEGFDGTSYVVVEVQSLWIYSNHWIESVSMATSRYLPDYDFSGLNGSYWKYTASTGYDADGFLDEEDGVVYDGEDHEAVIYAYIENIDMTEVICPAEEVVYEKVEFTADTSTSKMILIIVMDGKVYEKTYAIKSGMFFMGSENSDIAYMNFELQGTGMYTKSYYITSHEGLYYATAATKEEYNQAKEGVVNSSSESETAAQQTTNVADVEEVDIFGSYYWHNNSDGYEIYADVSWATDADDGEAPYMSISVVDDSSGDYTIFIGGILVNESGNTYTVEAGSGICSWTVTFHAESMEITVDDASSDDYLVIEGTYEKTGDLDLSEVG